MLLSRTGGLAVFTIKAVWIDCYFYMRLLINYYSTDVPMNYPNNSGEAPAGLGRLFSLIDTNYAEFKGELFTSCPMLGKEPSPDMAMRVSSSYVWSLLRWWAELIGSLEGSPEESSSSPELADSSE